MGATCVLHPIGTFSNVPPSRSTVKGKIFADWFSESSPGRAAAAAAETSDPVVVRRPTGSFQDATPFRGKIKTKMFADLFK